MRKIIAILTVCLMGTTGSVHASGIPTVDVANIIQTTVTALESVEQVANQVEQIRNQVNQFNKLQEQYQQQIAQFESLTGNYNMGGLLNTQAYQDARRFVPTTWQESLDLLEGALAAQNQRQTQTAARDARAAGEEFAAGDIYTNQASAKATRYIREANQIFTHMGVGQSNYAQSTQRVENVEDLIAEIDTANDLKAATDLNNRLSAENAVLMTELIKLQSAMHINQSEDRLAEHNRRATDVAMADGFVPAMPDLP